jgi:hypothetical protein
MRRRRLAVLVLLVSMLVVTPAKASMAAFGFDKKLASGNSILSPFETTVVAVTAMRSAPTNGTYYVGTAHINDTVRTYCFIWNEGQYWDAVFDRAGWGGDHFQYTAAFIPESSLASNRQGTACSSLQPFTNTQAYTMYGAPVLGTYYVGTQHAGDSVLGLASINNGDGSVWRMQIDFTGWGGDHLANTIGWTLDLGPV